MSRSEQSETIRILKKWVDFKIENVADESSTPWITHNQDTLALYLLLRILERLESIDDTLISILNDPGR